MPTEGLKGMVRKDDDLEEDDVELWGIEILVVHSGLALQR